MPAASDAVIGAHANYRREDFIFPRMQSRTMREARWAGRIRPLRSWGEIIAATLLLSVVSIVAVLSTSL